MKMEDREHYAATPASGLFLGRPTARRSDPDTSHAAADSVTRVRATQVEILRMLNAGGPATDEHLARQWACGPVSPSGLRTRRAELVALGLAMWNGDKERMATGRMARVWEITCAGRDLLR